MVLTPFRPFHVSHPVLPSPTRMIGQPSTSRERAPLIQDNTTPSAPHDPSPLPPLPRRTSHVPFTTSNLTGLSISPFLPRRLCLGMDGSTYMTASPSLTTAAVSFSPFLLSHRLKLNVRDPVRPLNPFTVNVFSSLHSLQTDDCHFSPLSTTIALRVAPTNAFSAFSSFTSLTTYYKSPSTAYTSQNRTRCVLP